MTKEEAIGILKEERWYMSRYSEEYKEAYDLAIESLSAEGVQGEWIDREDSTDLFFLYRYECSVCGGKNVFNSSYCPNCGAHMR